MSERIYKTLAEGRLPFHGGAGQWPEPGVWRRVTGELVPCQNGLHVSVGERQLLSWLGPVIWEVEVGSERVDHGDKVVVREARLLRRYDNWTHRTGRLFAADCADRVLHLYTAQYPSDDRVAQAISTARAYADGLATGAELAAARDAAWAAARDAAWAAARDAALAAAAAAARDAARDAAWAAAWAAAWDAARAAAWDAAGDAELQWQAARLRSYLDGTTA